MTETNKSGAMYILLAAVLWSLGGVLIKYIPWQPLVISGVRGFIAAIVLFLIKGSFKFKLSLHTLIASICYVLLSIFFVTATKLTTAANAIILQYTSPIFVILLSILLFKKLPSKKQILTIIIAFSGVILFFIDEVSPGAMVGNILAILAGVAYSGVFIFNSYEDADTLDSSIIGNFVLFVISIPILLQNTEPSLNMMGVFGIIILGIFQMGVSYACFSKGLETTPSIDASLISMIEAILNPILVAILLGELPSFISLIGGGLVLIAVIYNIIGPESERESLESEKV